MKEQSRPRHSLMILRTFWMAQLFYIVNVC